MSTETISERLLAAMQHAGKSKTDIVKHVGLSQGSLSYLLAKSDGRKEKRSKYTIPIAHYLGVNPRWLAEGVGGMHDKSIPDRPPVDLNQLDWELVIHCVDRVRSAKPDAPSSDSALLVQQLYQVLILLGDSPDSDTVRSLLHSNA